MKNILAFKSLAPPEKYHILFMTLKKGKLNPILFKVFHTEYEPCIKNILMTGTFVHLHTQFNRNLTKVTLIQYLNIENVHRGNLYIYMN